MVSEGSLNVVEELLLLAISEDGRLPSDDKVFGYVLVAGVLMELSLARRIDTDLDRLMVLNLAPLDDRMLDTVLVELVMTGREQSGDVRFWLEWLSGYGENIREEALEKLVDKGMVETRDKRLFGIFRSRRYSVIDVGARAAARGKVLRGLRSGDIPDPRVSLLICLADACRLLGDLLDGEEELVRLGDRLELIRRLELIGLVTSRAVDDIRGSLSVSIQSRRR